MPRKYRVHWAQPAVDDLERVISYIAVDDLEVAIRILKKIKKRASTLKTFPNRGRVVPELRNAGLVSCREVISNPWRIIYRVAGRDVWVLAVIDSRRNVEDVLLQRFFGE